MKKTFRIFSYVGTGVILLMGALTAWYLHSKQPIRSGSFDLRHLQATVHVDYDERGVPHIRAENETDLYRALGYLHAQDRLFQMEIMRRLAQGELAQIIGPQVLPTDKLMRTLGIRAKAEQLAATIDPTRPAHRALLAYLDGINQYQANHAWPMEFDILGIVPRPFTPRDTIAVSGYLAYSFAAALKTEPVLTYIRDQLGSAYLRYFDTEWHPQAVLKHANLNRQDWSGLNDLALASQNAMHVMGLPLLEGSNAWAIAGQHTVSGKPLLAGDPHIAYAVPAVWYEAHLSAPGFELYGHYQALVPFALLGHNTQFGWSLTMFQNDDMDLVAETAHPTRANQVWYRDQWVNLQMHNETIAVKGAAPVTLSLRRSPHGPLINEVYQDALGTTPVAMWWAFLEADSLLLDAFYALNRADTLDKARAAASAIHAPGLNVVWANAQGSIGWWAAAKLPMRPAGVNPAFILNAYTGEAEKRGFYHFSFNPQEENPKRGYIVSANQQPQPRSGVPVPGYYNLAERALRLDQALRASQRRWDTAGVQALQQDNGSAYGPRVLRELVPALTNTMTDANEKNLLGLLLQWDGNYTRDSVAATLFTQLLYEIAKAAMADELGDLRFQNLLHTRIFESALPALIADASSAWWDNVETPEKETRAQILYAAWQHALQHLRATYSNNVQAWAWGKTHTLTHKHPLGLIAPLDIIFNVGTFSMPGGRETPNNQAHPIGPAPWNVSYGPSTRRIIDFADATTALGINTLGQSGVLFDRHYKDQAEPFVEGAYVPQYLLAQDIRVHSASTLRLLPAP